MGTSAHPGATRAPKSTCSTPASCRQCAPLTASSEEGRRSSMGTCFITNAIVAVDRVPGPTACTARPACWPRIPVGRMIHRRRTHVALDRILGPARRRHTGNHRNRHRLVSATVWRPHLNPRTSPRIRGKGSPAVDSPALAALELRDFCDDALTQAAPWARHQAPGNDRVRWPQLTAEPSARVPGIPSCRAVAPGLGVASFAFAISYGAAA